ncbi:hypothetical protein BN12_1710004 [Nostocoides japonicum T1-X7]|uniref:Uncharacterized protein n=1 Tax=Nostocoides japonicum T1-X7 TaxID=1194083 RepID=A0A077LWL3_9MICO|nr:hypothetical protein BN12_1710004 [Tetrasphaera japonica T1-X7]
MSLPWSQRPADHDNPACAELMLLTRSHDDNNSARAEEGAARTENSGREDVACRRVRSSIAPAGQSTRPCSAGQPVSWPRWGPPAPGRRDGPLWGRWLAL